MSISFDLTKVLAGKAAGKYIDEGKLKEGSFVQYQFLLSRLLPFLFLSLSFLFFRLSRPDPKRARSHAPFSKGVSGNIPLLWFSTCLADKTDS